jgi:uncharacterized membrane protein YtjA (UPF0391 family)
MSDTNSTGAAAASSWPLASILTIVFLVLKLTHVINWGWWWIFSPLWISAAFTAGVVFLLFMVALIVTLAGSKK